MGGMIEENEAVECVMGGMIGGGRMKPVECGCEG